jgi:hypothetical protein
MKYWNHFLDLLSCVFVREKNDKNFTTFYPLFLFLTIEPNFETEKI